MDARLEKIKSRCLLVGNCKECNACKDIRYLFKVIEERDGRIEKMRKYLEVGCSSCKDRVRWRISMCKICERGKALSDGEGA